MTRKVIQAEIGNALDILNGYYEVNGGTTEVGEATLRLIAAAPALLDMVKKLHRKRKELPSQSHWDKAGELIDKVTGGAV